MLVVVQIEYREYRQDLLILEYSVSDYLSINDFSRVRLAKATVEGFYLQSMIHFCYTVVLVVLLYNRNGSSIASKTLPR